MSLRRRSFGGRSGVPPSRHSRQVSTNGSSLASSMRVPIGCSSIRAASDPAAICDCAFIQVTWVVLIVSNSISVRSSADSRVTAVSQKASIVRVIRRCWSLLNFVGREKSTVRSRCWRRDGAPSSDSGSWPCLAASTKAAI